MVHDDEINPNLDMPDELTEAGRVRLGRLLMVVLVDSFPGEVVIDRDTDDGRELWRAEQGFGQRALSRTRDPGKDLDVLVHETPFRILLSCLDRYTPRSTAGVMPLSNWQGGAQVATVVTLLITLRSKR